jgi:hypothetical protein
MLEPTIATSIVEAAERENRAALHAATAEESAARAALEAALHEIPFSEDGIDDLDLAVKAAERRVVRLAARRGYLSGVLATRSSGLCTKL